MFDVIKLKYLLAPNESFLKTYYILNMKQTSLEFFFQYFPLNSQRMEIASQQRKQNFITVRFVTSKKKKNSPQVGRRQNNISFDFQIHVVSFDFYFMFFMKYMIRI